jgi:hypothetical protein
MLKTDAEVALKSLNPKPFAAHPGFLWITLLIVTHGSAATLEKSSLSLGCLQNRQIVKPIRINNLRELRLTRSHGVWLELFLAPQHGFCA